MRLQIGARLQPLGEIHREPRRISGYTVGGKDPLATFLASMSRSERVEAVGRRSGLYLIAGSAAATADAA